MEDSELIKRSRQGDVEAFNFLVERYHKEILNLAFRMLGNLPDAEDICQNSWLEAWETVGRFRGGSFRSWILHITANNCRDEFRRRKRRTNISATDIPPPSIVDPKADTASRHEIVDEVKKSLLQLPYEQRLAITLREFNALSYDEIARVMKCSTGTVRSRLNRGRINLRNILRDRGFFE